MSGKRKVGTVAALAAAVVMTLGGVIILHPINFTDPNGIYVATTGSDSNLGTKASPYLTVNKANSVVTAGKTVHVAPGTYHNSGSSATVTTSTSGTSAARITYISDTKWGAKIASSSTADTWINNASWVDIVNFDVSADIGDTTSKIGIIQNGSNVRTIGDNLHNNGNHHDDVSCDSNAAAGVDDASASASNNEEIGNVVHDNGQLDSTTIGTCQTGGGIYHANVGGRVVNNIVYHNESWGIQTYHSVTTVNISGNTIFNNGEMGIVFGSSGGVTMDNATVNDNIIVDTHNAFVRAYQLYYTGNFGSNNKIQNNLIFNSGGYNTSVDNGAPTGVSGTITVNPLFVNYQLDGSGDYHVQSGSPAIDAGVSLAMPSTDFDGVVRPQGAAFDIGAYER